MTTYVLRNGKLVEKHLAAPLCGGGTNFGQGPQIIPDIEPYESVITGEQIGGRKQHRDHLRAYNMVERGNDAPAWLRDRQDRRSQGEPVDGYKSSKSGYRGPID